MNVAAIAEFLTYVVVFSAILAFVVRRPASKSKRAAIAVAIAIVAAITFQNYPL